MGVIHLGPLSALPGTCIVLRALAMLYDPGGTCTVLAYRPAHYCLRLKLEYRLPLVVLSRLNRFTLSHYGSRTPLSTLHAGLTASHARLSTGCLLGFAGSGLSPDYTVHAELAHNFRTLGATAPSNFRTLKPHRGLSIRRPTTTLAPKGETTHYDLCVALLLQIMFAVHAKGASNFSPLRTFGPKGRQPSSPKGACQ